MTEAPKPPGPWTELESLLLACLECPDDERAAALDGLCAQHPQHAAALRKRFSVLSQLGFVAGPAPPTVGESLGEYRLIRRLGSGAMGVVYLAGHRGTDRQVALKILRPEFLGSERARERFRRELAAATRLEHPGICPVYDAGEVDGQPFIAMRYVAGESLAEAIARAHQTGDGTGCVALTAGDEDQRIQAVVAMIEKTARALHAAHTAGLVHRDVKPANILVTPEGEPVLVDFGLARDDVASGPSLTASADALGTPAYMAPEQIAPNGRRVDGRTDTYALAVVLFECLTLHAPYQAANREALFRQILTDEPPDPRRRNARVPHDLAVIVAKALEKEPARRYATALAFAEDLRRVRAREPILARPAGRWLRTRRWAQRNPLLAGVLLASFVSLGAGLAVTLTLLLRVQRTLLERQARDLAVASRQALDHDTALAVRLAREAVEVEVNDTTLSALYAALAEPREVEVHPLHGPYSVAAPADGAWFVVGTYQENRVVIYAPGVEPVDLPVQAQGHRTIHRVVVSGDDRSILVLSLQREGAAAGGLATVWALGAPLEPRLRLPHPAGVLDGCLAADGRVLTAGVDGIARLWPADGGQPIALAHSGRVSACAISPDGELLVTGSHDCTVRLWSARDGMPRKELPHHGWVTAIEFAADGRFVTATGYDQLRSWWDDPGHTDDSARVFDRHGELLCRLEGHRDGLTTARFARDGAHVLTTSLDHTARLWRLDPAGPPALVAVLPHDGTAYVGCFDAAGTRVATVSRSGTAYLWTLDGDLVATLRGHRRAIMGCCFVGDRVVTASLDNSVREWTGESAFVPTWQHRKLAWATAARDGQWLAAIDASGVVRVSERKGARGEVVPPFATGIANAMTLACSPDGQRLLVGDEGGVLHLFGLDGQRLRPAVQAHSRRVARAQFSSDGAFVLSGGHDGQVCVWSGEGEPVVRVQPAPVVNLRSEPFWDAALVPDDEHFAVAVDDLARSVRIHHVADGALVSTFGPHEEVVRRVAFTRDGAQLACVTWSGAVYLWHVPTATGGRIRQLERDATAVAIAPDGSVLACGLMDGTVHLLRADGTAIAALPRQAGRIRNLEFLDEGTRLLVVPEQGRVSEWIVGAAELLAASRQD